MAESKTDPSMCTCIPPERDGATGYVHYSCPIHGGASVAEYWPDEQEGES